VTALLDRVRSIATDFLVPGGLKLHRFGGAAHAFPGATLRAIQAVLEAQHGRKLSLDALHCVLSEPRIT
jgi:hypothetical protein